MTDFDVAVVGSSLFSGLVAGILARDHGRNVVRIGRKPSAQRLPRRVDLALALSARPATWTMMRRAEAETATLLGSIGVAESLEATEMGVVADLPDSQRGLDHIAHIAASSGHQVRRLTDGWAFRRVPTIDREAVDARLTDWLKAAGVKLWDDGTADAALTVLADDDAILSRLPAGDRPSPLVSQAMTSTLVAAPRSLPVPVQRYIDRGVTLVSRPGNVVLALIAGEADVEARLASALPGPFPMRRLATTRYRRFTTADGAPVIGMLPSSPVFVAAGLGDAGAFLATAIARLVIGTPSEDERVWFAPHAPSLPREAVADFAPAMDGAP